MIPVPWQVAVFFILIYALFGSVIGLVSATVVFRARLSMWLLVRGAAFGALAFLIAVVLITHADMNTSWVNGHRMDGSPSIWLRNRIAEYKLIAAAVASCVAGLLAGTLGGHNRSESHDRSESHEARQGTV